MRYASCYRGRNDTQEIARPRRPSDACRESRCAPKGELKVARILLTLLVLLGVSVSASAQVVFSTNMDNPNAGGAGVYGFGGVHRSDGQWSVTNLPAEGWRGSGAAQVNLHANHRQYMFGWWTPDIAWSPTLGNSVFIRLRMKFPSGHPSSPSTGIKFILMGNLSDGTDNTSRTITFLGSEGGHVCVLNRRRTLSLELDTTAAGIPITIGPAITE